MNILYLNELMDNLKTKSHYRIIQFSSNYESLMMVTEKWLTVAKYYTKFISHHQFRHAR